MRSIRRNTRNSEQNPPSSLVIYRIKSISFDILLVGLGGFCSQLIARSRIISINPPLQRMEYNSDIHHRRSIRLVGYDYSRSGAYFITICNHNRECIFGEIVDRAMNYNELGNIARSHWQKLAIHHPNIEIDESIVMPNHLHGIIIIHESSKPISEIIRGFKTFSARQINKLLDRTGIPVWQRNYYERIIRSKDELNNIRQYIINNPANWNEDKNNINP